MNNGEVVMKLKLYIKVLMVFLLTQSLFNNKISSADRLKKYIETSRTRDDEKRLASGNMDPDLINLGTGCVAGAFLAKIALPTTALALAPLSPLYYGLGTAAVLAAPKLYNLYKYYSIRAPHGFTASLKKLEELIDQKKTVLIGGKEYFVAKNLNNVDNSGYQFSIGGICQSSGNLQLNDPIKNQYEIYIMPNNKNLVVSFEKIVSQLSKDFKDNINFIAVRPTPIATNDVKQALPRIIVVFNKNADKNIVENALKKIYLAMQEIEDIKAFGHSPRYSTVVTFIDPFKKKTSLENIVFIAMGNSDFKVLYPREFERKSFLGISRSGDMTYPINTDVSKKISSVKIETLKTN